MKGDTASTAIILIIVVIAVVVLFMLFSGGGISFPGSSGVTYSNDVVTVTQKLVSDQAPYAGQKTTIEFTVVNRGKGDIEDVKVALEPPTGFTSKVDCDGSCTFNLEEGDAKDILITLTAVPEVTQIIPVDVKYSVSYSYEGEREAHIPIVADKDELPRGQSYFIGGPTYGPVQVSIGTPTARQAGDGSSAVFAVSEIPFKLDFSVSDVGGGAFGSGEKVVMKGDDLELELTNLKTVGCDKIDEATNALKSEGDEADPKNAGETLPFNVHCTFEPTSSELSDGVVKIVYKYDYRLPFSDRFNIVPKGTPKFDIPSSSSGSSSETVQTGQTGDSEETAPVTEEGPGNAGSIGQVGNADLPGHRGSAVGE